ncbi:MAG: hypothetical protein J6T01_06155 [Kiritimatiellae bacterium]|nr:hypothetical protein [Kiritimatiellia bacterium]
MKLDESPLKADLTALMLLVGVVQMALYYLGGATVRSDGFFGVAQPDTLLYCQAARRIVEGHPFSFSEGVAMTTGTTTVLYPFVLAVPYALGATGDALFRAGFLLNAAFYLVFLFGWGVTIRAKLGGGVARFTAALLVALSGQAAYCAAAQSDIGFWMAVSSLVIAGLATGRRGLYAPLLMLAPWVRPEGMILALAFVSVVFLLPVFRRRPPRGDVVLALLLLFSVAGVFLLNTAITGKAGFSSVANKGHFRQLPFCDAVVATAVDSLAMAKSFLLGLSRMSTREFYWLPVIAAAFMWVGACVRDWREKETWRDLALALAVVGSFGTVAVSGWQGTNMDRYLAWCLPVVSLLAAEGVEWFAGRLGNLPARFMPAVLVTGFACVSSAVCVSFYHSACLSQSSVVSFAGQCERTMIPGSAVGVFGSCGLVYEFSPRRLAHLPGIYSPEFQSKDPTAVVETLKREKDTRFFYWLFSKAEAGALGAALEKPGLDVIGGLQLAGPHAMELRKADWTAFDAAAADPPPPARGLSLRDRVDVGYEKDERKSAFDVITTYDQPALRPFVACEKLNGTNAVEVGRMLLGGAEMTVSLAPGRDAYVVLRTLARAKAFAPGIFGSAAGGEYSFENPMELHLEVDGREIGHATFRIADGGFTDASFKIPGSAITRNPCRVALHGDHAACGYWFFQ